MNVDRTEDVSAMIDDELEQDGQHLVDDLLNTPLLRERWRSYHLIRDSLQHQLPEKLDKTLASSVAAKIDNEPHILAPVKKSQPAYLKPLAGLAIAASVAALAIVVLQPAQEGSSEQGIQVASFTPVGTPVTSQARQDDAQIRQVRAEARARLNSYLVNYNEYQTNSGIQGMLPYARTVTYENNRK
ncbi:MAG: hypothetical protein GKR93_07475 [Gammaproteobacteria bacterium]|nr:hypothetical protein [Gammaproteobacteria bacterium]